MGRVIINLIVSLWRHAGELSARDATLSSSSNLYFLHPPLRAALLSFRLYFHGKIESFCAYPLSPCPWIIFTVIFHLSDIDSLGLDNNPLTSSPILLSPFYTFQSCFVTNSVIFYRSACFWPRETLKRRRGKRRYIYIEIPCINKTQLSKE